MLCSVIYKDKYVTISRYKVKDELITISSQLAKIEDKDVKNDRMKTKKDDIHRFVIKRMVTS